MASTSNTANMANLAKLPTELLLAIIHSPSEDPSIRILNTGDRASLARVSRRLHSVVNPVIYSISMTETDFDWSPAMLAVDKNNLDTLKVVKSVRPCLDWRIFREACRLSRHEIVEWLLDSMPVMPDKDESSKEELSWALQSAFANRASENTIILLLSRTHIPDLFHMKFPSRTLGDADEPAYTTPLHCAAEANMLRVVDHLVWEMCFPVDARDANGYSALLWAMKREFDRPFEKYTPLEGDQPQEETEIWGSEDVESDEVYWPSDPDEEGEGAEGEDDETDDTDPGVRLCRFDDVRMLEKLIDFGADINIEVNGMIPLTAALKSDKYYHALSLIDAGAKINPSQPGVPFAIHDCVGSRHNYHVDLARTARERVFQRILQLGGDLEEKYEGHTVLEHAVLRGGTQTVSMALDMGARMSTEATAEDNIMDFLIRNYDEIPDAFSKVCLFLKRGARMDTPLASIDGESVLMYVANREREIQGQLEKLLILASPSTLSRDHLDDVLLRCIERGPTERENCQLLLRYGAVIKDFDRAYDGLVHFLERSDLSGWGDDEIDDLWYLVRNTGFTMERLCDLFTHAVAVEDEIAAHALLNQLNQDLSDQKREWLHSAIAMRMASITRRLLRANMDVNALSKRSRTPLAEAMADYDEDLVHVLLSYGADPFLPRKRPVDTNGEDDIDPSEIPGISAFEIGIRSAYKGSLDLLKIMWRMTAPEARPDLGAYISCVPCGHPSTAKWLRQASGKMEDDKGKGKAKAT
ncbi:ankyrin [Hypoxylon sp. FL0543]|nr:ankyrin [Hypoxylon sp. FL0543]